MPKTIRKVFRRKLNFIKLYEAHQRAKMGKTGKISVMKFEMDLENNIANLVKQIKAGTYKIGKYRDFTIYEPKERLIRALPYRDRVVHQWYVHEFIKEYIQPKFISDSYACIEQKGTHRAVSQLQHYMRIMKRKYLEYYIVKCDVKKFFYNIDKEILFDIMNRYIKDEELLCFTKTLIFDDESDKGIPIGNYTSQFFANIYLNELDMYMKKILHIKYYVRYMDDFIFLAETKESAKKKIKLAEKFINEKLKLELNHKSRYYPNQMGVEFCGYRIYETHRLLKNNSKKKIKKKIKIWNKQYVVGNLNERYVTACWNSWIAHANNCNSYHFQTAMYEKSLFQKILIPSKKS